MDTPRDTTCRFCGFVGNINLFFGVKPDKTGTCVDCMRPGGPHDQERDVHFDRLYGPVVRR